MQQKKRINNKILLVDGITRRYRLSSISNVEYRTNPKKAVLYSGLKMFGALLVVVVILVNLSSVGGTVSYFNDSELSISNYLKADPLSFKVEFASSTDPHIDMSQGEKLIVPVMTPGADSEPIQYFVKANFTGGDEELCGKVHVLGTWPFLYDNKLLSLSTGTTTTVGPWTLTFSLKSADTFNNTSCTVDLFYQGWNDGVPLGGGYKDSHKISLTLYVPDKPPAVPVVLVVPETTSPDPIIENNSNESSTTPQEIIPQIISTEATTTPEDPPADQTALPPDISTSTPTTDDSEVQPTLPVSEEVTTETSSDTPNNTSEIPQTDEVVQ